jgi:dihydrofolate reductase
VTRIQYYTATSADGFIADEHNSLDWLFEVGRGVETAPEDSHETEWDEFIGGVGSMAMGATTYEWILEHEDGKWPYTLPMWVMTHRGLKPPAEPKGPVTFASGGVREVYDEMVAAAGGKDLWVVGGGDLVGQFADEGLLDEVITYIAPVTLGAGRPILPRRLDLELVEATQNKAFIAARYRFVGPMTEDR